MRVTGEQCVHGPAARQGLLSLFELGGYLHGCLDLPITKKGALSHG